MGGAKLKCALFGLSVLLMALCVRQAPAAAQAQAASVEAPQPQPLLFDPEHTRLGFRLHTRWGQILDGWFPRYDASVTVLADGRHQVQLHLYVADLDVADSPRYSDFARSDKFFDARQYPQVTWVSDPYDVAILARGGHLPGTLTIRGISRPRAMELKPPPPGCAHPGYDCDVQATGDLSRADYGMDGWKMMIDDHVEFVLRMRMRPLSVSPVAP